MLTFPTTSLNNNLDLYFVFFGSFGNFMEMFGRFGVAFWLVFSANFREVLGGQKHRKTCLERIKFQ